MPSVRRRRLLQRMADALRTRLAQVEIDSEAWRHALYQRRVVLRALARTGDDVEDDVPTGH